MDGLIAAPGNNLLGPTNEQKAQARQRGKQLRRVAERLGVAPVEAGVHHYLTFSDDQGNTYPWLALVEAHLDYVDRA